MKISLPVDSPLRSREFVFGIATSSYQIEGAAEKRLPCIWDTFCALPGTIRDNTNGGIACDHVARWQEDIDLIEFLGVDAYRFSISWPRVGNVDGSSNPDGLDFYVRLLDRLNDKGIRPFVTLYHWDLPQHLEDRGGWLNRQTAYHFRDYVDQVTRAFGDRVYSYATLNEPFCSAYLGYETGMHAPGRKGGTLGKKAAHNLFVAHGLAMQVLDTNSPDSDNGIVLNVTPCYPASDSDEDIAAARRADEVFNRWYIEPIIEGRYPELIDRLTEDELPEIHAGDLDLISHPLDNLGINYYTRAVYRAGSSDSFVQAEPSTALTDMGWEIYPQGLTDLMVSLDRTYELPPIYIAENGAAMDDTMQNGEVNDLGRIEYLQAHLEAVNDAIVSGVDIRGYFCWSLMDNFEWAEGFEKTFGIVHVDFETQQRQIKASGRAYREMMNERVRADDRAVSRL